MDFASPRFAGNAVLEEILSDPDTGSKKLRKNSEGDAVRRVQKALNGFAGFGKGGSGLADAALVPYKGGSGTVEVGFVIAGAPA